MSALANIDHQIHIAASKQRVWTVLTQPGLVEEWLGCMEFSPELGKLFYMQPSGARRIAGDTTGATHCELVALESPDRMAFTWFMPGTPKTLVEITLTDNGDGSTTVRLVHSGWDQFSPDDVRQVHDMLDGGWSSFVLPGLKRVSESV